MTCNNNITLRWLNYLGGWEQWTFTARHTYGIRPSNQQDFKVDVFTNWDEYYISGQVETKTLSLDATQTILLRSGILNKGQVEGLKTIVYSPNVQTVSGELVTPDQTVVLNRTSIQYRTDREDIIEISFTIELPTIQIQTA